MPLWYRPDMMNHVGDVIYRNVPRLVLQAQTRYDGNPHLLFVINTDTNEASFCKLSAKVRTVPCVPRRWHASFAQKAS